jgi:hypothetical protein
MVSGSMLLSLPYFKHAQLWLNTAWRAKAYPYVEKEKGFNAVRRNLFLLLKKARKTASTVRQ